MDSITLTVVATAIDGHKSLASLDFLTCIKTNGLTHHRRTFDTLTIKLILRELFYHPSDFSNNF
jgi:hypothetical protein